MKVARNLSFLVMLVTLSITPISSFAFGCHENETAISFIYWDCGESCSQKESQCENFCESKQRLMDLDLTYCETHSVSGLQYGGCYCGEPT